LRPAARALRLRPDDFRDVADLLAWHPSESTAVLYGATTGARGRVQTRTTGVTVVMTDTSADGFIADAERIAQQSTLLTAYGTQPPSIKPSTSPDT
jgi:hypothetical protein